MKNDVSSHTVSYTAGIIGVTVWYLQILEISIILNLRIQDFYDPTQFYSLCYVKFMMLMKRKALVIVRRSNSYSV